MRSAPPRRSGGGCERAAWGLRKSRREKCAAAASRPMGRLPRPMGACGASDSLQIARRRLLENAIRAP
eukprot:scaffold23629_cov38-Phaeocystis_antarctica.AAC.1